MLIIAVEDVVHVIGTGVGDGVAQSQSMLDAGVVVGHLLPLDVHGQPLRATPYPFSGPLGSFRQQVADALAGSDQLQQLQHDFGVAETQVQPAGILRREQPLLKALHGKGNGAPNGDGVQTQGVASLAGLGHGVHVGHAAVGAKAGRCLVLRSAICRVHRIRLLQGGNLLAADSAGVATLHTHDDRLGQALAAQNVRPVQVAIAEVVNWQCAVLVVGDHADARAQLGELAHQVSVVVSHPARQGADSSGVGQGDFAGAANGNSLQFFGSHHRAQASASGGVLQVGHNVGVADQLLARWPAEGHAGPLFAQLLADGGVGRLVLQPPQVGGVP